MRIKSGLLAVCLLCVMETAWAGAVFRVEVENFGEDNQFFEAGQSYTTITKVEGNRMQSDTLGEDGKTTASVIFLGDSDEMYMVDHGKKNCLVMDKDSIEALGQKMGEVMKQMEAALAQVPPGQRGMMERMMKDKLAADPNYKEPAPPVVRNLGESSSVNGISCAWKEVTRDGALSEKACVCDPNEIAGGKEMVALAGEMKNFAEGLTKLADKASSFKMFGGSTMQEVGMLMTTDLGGFSLISEHFDGEGKLMRRSTFQSADDVAIQPGEFAPPEGYKKQTMQQIMR